MRQIYKHDKTQKRQYTIRHYTQVWHNIKRQNTTQTEYKKTKHKMTDCKYDKIQNKKNTNVAAHKKTKYKYNLKQKDKIQSSTNKKKTQHNKMQKDRIQM